MIRNPQALVLRRSAMTDGGRTQVEVAVALVTDPGQRVLLTLNEGWGAFTLPMTGRRRGAGGNEPWARAALRAAVEALGVPVRAVEGGASGCRSGSRPGGRWPTRSTPTTSSTSSRTPT